MTLEDIKRDDLNLFILSRFMYRIGEPIIADNEYDNLALKLKDDSNAIEYIDRTYDDDPIPFDILNDLNWMYKIPNFGSNSEYAQFLEEEKSLSIKAVTNYYEIFEYFNSHRKDKLIFSLKMDGANSKTYYKKDFKVSLSRGRQGSNRSLDYSNGNIKVLPHELKGSENGVKVFAEVFVDPDYLPVLRDKYPKDFKTPKSSAISMLRTSGYDMEDYDNLIPVAFYAEGLPNVKTVSDILEYLGKAGFFTAPHYVLEPNSYPETFEEFQPWIEKKLYGFYNQTKFYSSDGLVVDVDDLHYVAEEKGAYSSRNIAIKLGPWEYKRYTGKVINIIFEQQRVNCSCVLEIEPLITEDGCQVSRVNAYNLDVLIRNNIKIGSTIEFERSSETYSTLIYEK